FNEKEITFAVGPETLKVTGWLGPANLLTGTVNCERSLRFGDRIHGHLVTGHVDSVARVLKVDRFDQSLIFEIEVPENIAPLVWKKGSLALNGVSLTINEVAGSCASFCLIPETLKRTNLANLKTGNFLNLEADNYARGMLRQKEFEA
ncbi:MAG: riboflavin synthase, partial [Bdellovibrionia bacterium]